MTDNTDTDALRELLAKATPGEWRLSKLAPSCVEAANGRSTATTGGYQSSVHDTLAENNANAALIVALKNAAPALLDELDTLRAQVADLTARVAEVEARAGEWCGLYLNEGERTQALTAKLVEAEAENARLSSGVGPDDPTGCPGGQGASCCGYHEVCRTALESGNDG